MISPKILNRVYKSGFKAEIILKPEFKQRFFGVIVDFGSSDPQIIPGTAHFLEHKLFAKKEGDLSHQFEELGADVNAFTSFNETMFYCSGVNHNQKLIELLFRLVGEPYFTPKNVSQEEPIIQQELAMYKDEPNWLVNNALMQMMFTNSNLGIDVAGTPSSIAQINNKNLRSVYQANYVPNKMHFVACGDFSEYQSKMIFRMVGKLQEKYFANRPNGKLSFVTQKGELQDREINTNSNSNLFGVGIRLQNFKKVLSSLDLAQILLEIMLESKLSVMGPWFEQMKRKGLLNNSLQISVNYTRQGNFVTIFGISHDSAQVINAIKEEVQKPLTKDDHVFANKFFEIQKKEWLAQHIRSTDNLAYFAVEMAEESLDNENSCTNLEKLQTMSFKYYVQFCSELMKNSEICSARLKKEEK